MSTCDKNKAPFTLTASGQQAMKDKSRREGALMTLQDYIDFLHTGYEDMFEIAAAPEAVMNRMRQELDGRCPVAIRTDGPQVVDGCIQMTIESAMSGTAPLQRTTIIVYPEGDHEVTEGESRR